MPHGGRRSKTRGKAPTTDKVTIAKWPAPIQVIKEYGRSATTPSFVELHLLMNQTFQKSFFPYLKDELSSCRRVEGSLRSLIDGDYICHTVLRVCEILRSKDPRYDNMTPLDMAKVIMSYFSESDMIKELKLLDLGLIYFKLDGAWIAERIRKNLKEGIASWAPLIPMKKVVIDTPVDTFDVRAYCITQTLARLFEFSGIEVCLKRPSLHPSSQSFKAVQRDFPLQQEEEGMFIISRRTFDRLFILEENPGHPTQPNHVPNHVYKDLAVLWYGVHLKADQIILVTPVRQREYILKCFNAAKDFVNEHPIDMSYLGYQTSLDEIEKLSLLWRDFGLGTTPSHERAITIGVSFGYMPRQVLECMLRYEYLKKSTYCGCTFEDEEMFGTEGNTFLHLLEKKAIMHRVLEHYRPNLDSKKELVGREREMGLHLIQFTEIIEDSVLQLKPHSLCEYLYNLCKKFTIHEIDGLSETKVLLFKAASVVIDKGFEILGITPEGITPEGITPEGMRMVSMHPYFESMHPYFETARHHFFAWPSSYPLRKVHSRSRFEILSMHVDVFPTDFKNGYLFGGIIVSDKLGVNPDKWCYTNTNGCGKVAYLDHDWYDPMEIGRFSLKPLPLGDPASCFSLPLSDCIEISTHLWATSNEKEKVYQLCSVESEEGKIELEDFWLGHQKIKHSTFQVSSKNGCVRLNYFLIKEAVDTSFSLKYELDGHNGHNPRLRGHIQAFYGEDCYTCTGINRDPFKALIFCTGPSAILVEGNLMLQKSTLAVPEKGALEIRAYFEDADTGKEVLNKGYRYEVKKQGRYSKCSIDGDTFRFILTVEWIRDRLKF